MSVKTEMASIIDWRHGHLAKEVNDVTLGMDGLKISALAKASAMSKVIKDVTIGPNSEIKCQNDGAYNGEQHNFDKKGCAFLFSDKLPNNNYISRYLKVVNLNKKSEFLKGNDTVDESSRTMMKLMHELDQQRQMGVKESIKEQFLKLEENSRTSRLELENKHLFLQRQSEARVLHEEEQIFRQQHEEEVRACQRQQRLAQEYKQHAQHLNEWNQRMKEEERRQKEAEEEGRRKIQEKKLQLEKIYQFQLDYRSKYEQIAEAAKHCKDRQAFIEKISSHTAKLKNLNEAMDQLVKQCKVGEITNLEVQTASSILQQVDGILSVFREESEKINAAIEKTESEANVAKKEETNSQAADKQSSQSAIVSSDLSEGINEFVEKEAFQKYLSLQQHLQNFESSFETLLKDERMKKFRFECQKAVNIPVNAISPVSCGHLLDKLVKLSRLISGKPVEVGHNRTISASVPESLEFCMNLLAKKFVWQGELTVSSKPEAAFAIAAVIVALWADFPDFGKLVLGHFYRECPYLVPMFMPQVEGQSNEDYYRSLGYHYNDSGEVEKQDKFLKRMSGIMRLYAAILITRPCRHQKNMINPHGLSEAWHWLSSMLNMDPRPDICATLMYDFLEVTGNSMYKHYGQQFQKLLYLICKEYYPKIEKITPSVSSGPMIRLEAFLQKILKQGHIPPPIGILPANFW